MTQFNGTPLRVDTTRVLSLGGFLPHMGAIDERTEFDKKQPLEAPLLIFCRVYLLMTFPQEYTSQDSGGLKS